MTSSSNRPPGSETPQAKVHESEGLRSEVVVREGRVYHLGLRPDEIARRIVLVGDPARAHKVAAHFDRIDHRVAHREYVTLTGRHRGLDISVIGTGMGTDNVEIALIELHALATLDLATCEPLDPAARRTPLDIIRVGTSGGVQGDVPPGTLCIAEYALGLDSTGSYYEFAAANDVVEAIEVQARRLLAAVVAPNARFRDRLPVYASRADTSIYRELMRAAQRAGESLASGITVAAPGFYGPSSRRIAGVENTVPDIKGTLAEIDVDGLRVLNMEMESSLLFHLAGALGHRAGTLCPAISGPNAAGTLVDYDARIEVAIGIALEAMGALAHAESTD